MQQKSACFRRCGKVVAGNGARMRGGSAGRFRRWQAGRFGGKLQQRAGGDEESQRMSALTRATLDRTCALGKLGPAMAAKTAMMAATIGSSMRVNPGRFPVRKYLLALSALRLSPSCACFLALVLRGLSAAARPAIVSFPHSPKSMGHPSPPPCMSRRSPLLFVPFVAS